MNMGKKYTLNEYYPNADNSTSTRAEVYADNGTAANLLAYHKQHGAVEISLAECIGESVSELPMPHEVMTALDVKIKTAGKRVVVTGIDSYLVLLNDINVKSFMVALHSRVDENKLNAVYMICESHFDSSKFSNPKFTNSLAVVYVLGGTDFSAEPTVTVVSDKWVSADNNPTSWKALITRLGQFEPTGDCLLVLGKYKNKQAGLSDIVTQLIEIKDIAARYYNISADLPKTILESLIAKCK
jgi:hypothetical protein